MTTIDTAAIEPLSHEEAMDLQAVELDRTLALLRSLGPSDWTARTDCPAWDVRQMYLHVLGACEAAASMRENVHQMRVARKRRRREGGPLEAALSATQVSERADMTPEELVDRLAEVAPRAVRGRRRLPGVVRSGVRMKVDGPVHETWKLGYLIDTIYLRDLWMHRIDTCHALGREPELSPEHDGRIVADVVGEWALRHGQPFVLDLEGPAGGTFTRDQGAPSGDQVERLRYDAVEFCRTLAEREPATGLLATIVPF